MFYLFDLILRRCTVCFGGPICAKVSCNISVLFLKVRQLILKYSKVQSKILCCLTL